MITDLRCAEHDTRKIESLLLGHEIARNYFRGELYDWLGNRFDEILLEQKTGEPVKLDAKTSSRGPPASRNTTPPWAPFASDAQVFCHPGCAALLGPDDGVSGLE
ncbi:hypothetical protein F2P45_06540 [Massilia sp. CCM 8733]|uniref:Uncharacterized protein n=1 Tax=Massilia mucilaginosa TaxID=2609282 RepID=A0ABX0NP99_9BURK|nr:hypothetical protein [Massilia mucilaginosa]NHZ88683.1 hypothetical protein [Massilia mucilaginosa]